MTDRDIERVREMAERACGRGIVVKGPTFETNEFVVFREVAEGKLDEIVRIPDAWVKDGEWHRVEGAINDACA